MRVFFLSLFLAGAIPSFGQLTEIEPNNSQGQANAWPENTSIEGWYSIGGIWPPPYFPDVFRMIPPDDGKIMVVTRVSVDTALGVNEFAPLITADDAPLYECTASWPGGPMTWIAPAGIGSLVVDSFEFRCAPKDTFFLMVRSESSHTLAFHYYLSWTFIPASLPVDTEPNDLPAQAAPWPEDSVMGGHLYRTCVWLDEDIYRIVLPYSPDQITFLAHVENGSDAPGQMSVAVLDGSGATLASGTLTAGPFGAPLQDTLSLALPFADTIYVQMSESSSCGIAYALHYELGTDTLFAGNPESPTTHDDGLIVLPNPVSGTAQFNAPIHGSGKAEVMIFDASSALLAHFDRSISHNACSGELDMTAYPAGVYVVRISTLEQSFATRFVVIP